MEKKWTLGPGRTLSLDGVMGLEITRTAESGTGFRYAVSPAEADQIARVLLGVLNLSHEAKQSLRFHSWQFQDDRQSGWICVSCGRQHKRTPDNDYLATSGRLEHADGCPYFAALVALGVVNG